MSIMRPTDELQAAPTVRFCSPRSMLRWGFAGISFYPAGRLLAAATLGAYFFLKDFFFVWMAVAGGGSLLLTGLWMRNG